MGATIYYTEFESDYAHHYWYNDVASTWEKVDLFDASDSEVSHAGVTSLGIPASAVVEVICRNINTSNSFTQVGARAEGSSTSRIINLHEAEDGGHVNVSMFVQSSSGSNIEVYSTEAGATTGSRFSVAGYWLGAEYVDLFETFQIAAEDTWTTHALSGLNVPSGAIVEIAAINMSGGYVDAQAGISNIVGARSVGSSVERKLSLHEPEVDIESDTLFAREYCTMQVQSSGESASIEVYAEHSGVAQFAILGYWDTAPGTYTETIVSVDDADATGWLERNVSGVGIPVGSVAEFQIINGKDNGEVTMGIQGVLTSTERKLRLHETEPSGFHSTRMNVQVDTSGNVYVFHGYHIYDHSFTAFGYWDDFNDSLFALNTSSQSNLFIEGLNPNMDYVEYWTDEFTAGSTSAWESYNVSDLGIQKSTENRPIVAEVVITNDHTSVAYTGGVRSVGSSLERRFDIHPAIGFGVDALSILVPVDSNGDIEIYAENTTYVAFRIIGMWRGATYVESMDNFNSTADASWANHNLGSAYADTVAEIVVANTNTTVPQSGGIRQVGSALNRYEDITKGSVSADYTTMSVNTSGANGAVQVYASASGDIDFTAIGYWGTLPGIYHEAFSTSGDVTLSDTWESDDIGVASDSIVEMILSNRHYSSEYSIGVREVDSSNDRRFTLRSNNMTVGVESADTVRMHATIVSDTNAELYWDLISRPRTFRTIGYWDELGAIPTTTSGTCHMYTQGSGITLTSGSITLYCPDPRVPSGYSGDTSLMTLAGIFTDSSKSYMPDPLQLFVHGHTTIDNMTQESGAYPSGLSLYTVGPVSDSGNTTAYVYGCEVASGYAPLVVWFPIYAWTFYLEAGSDTRIGNIDLFARGSPSGTDDIYSNASLYLEASEATYPYTGGGTEDWTLYLHATGTPTTTNEWAIFLNADTTTHNNTNLYTYAHGVGESPRGPKSSGTLKLFVANIADRSRWGFTPDVDEWSLFLRVTQGWFDDMSLLISGHAIPGTGDSSSGDLFIRGNNESNSQITLHTFGISGSIDNGTSGLPLFIHSVTGVYNTNVNLYAHGY